MKKHRPERAEELQTPVAGTHEDCQAALFPFVLPNKATHVIPWVLAYKQRTKFVPLLHSSVSTAECNQWQNLVRRVQLQKQIQCDTAQAEELFSWWWECCEVLKPHLCCLKNKECYDFGVSYSSALQLLQKMNLSGNHAQKPILFHISYIQHCLKEMIEKTHHWPCLNAVFITFPFWAHKTVHRTRKGKKPCSKWLVLLTNISSIMF